MSELNSLLRPLPEAVVSQFLSRDPAYLVTRVVPQKNPNCSLEFMVERVLGWDDPAASWTYRTENFFRGEMYSDGFHCETFEGSVYKGDEYERQFVLQEILALYKSGRLGEPPARRRGVVGLFRVCVGEWLAGVRSWLKRLF